MHTLRCSAPKTTLFFCLPLLLPGLSIYKNAHAQANRDSILNNPKELPFGVFPHVNTLKDNEYDTPTPTKKESLKSEAKVLGFAIKETVENFANRRNFSCLGRPCLVQAFPLLYSHPNSGFFGGLRANIRDISREDPPHYVANALLIRSDTDQWLSFLAFDFPRIEFLPLEPRLKIKGVYSKTTEIRYFGMGQDAVRSLNLPDEQLRYGIVDQAFYSTLIVPAFEIQKYKVAFFGSFNSDNENPSRFSRISKLYEDQPVGLNGGSSSSLGIGLLLDSRDREDFTRHGWSLEISSAVSGNPAGDFSYHRFTFVDRHYFSWGANTWAFRTTEDSLSGNIPFWALEEVGGIDPVLNVGGSGILRGFSSGRFHEKYKLIESTEYRRFLRPRRWFGQYLEIIWTPLGVDLARMGPVNVISATTGIDLFFNKSFLVRLSASQADQGSSLSLNFDQEF